MFLEATNAVGRRAERIVAAEQNLRCWDARRKRRPVRLERHIVMELAQLVINAVRRLIGKRVAAGYDDGFVQGSLAALFQFS